MRAMLSRGSDFSSDLCGPPHGRAIATEVAPTGFPAGHRAQGALLQRPESAHACYALAAALPG